MLRTNLFGSLVYCSLFSWILFACLRVCLDNNCLISFFVVCSAKHSLCFVIESVLCLKFWTFLVNQNKKFCVLVLLQACCPQYVLALLSWLDEIVLKFIFLVLLCWYKRYNICLILLFSLYELFPAFFVVIIQEIWLIVCLELQLGFLFLLFLFLHYLLVVAWVVYLLLVKWVTNQLNVWCCIN